MKSDILKIILFLIVMIFSISLVSAESNFTSLQNDIDNALDEFNMTDDYKYVESVDSHLKDGVVINKSNFVVDGNYHTVNGDNKARIFNISGNNVTIKNINLINATINNIYDKSMGGAIYNSGNGTKIINNNFTNNIAYGYANYNWYIGYSAGGAIYNTGDNVDIMSNNFTYNSVYSDSYHTVNIYGGAIYNLGDSLKLYNNNFYNNSLHYPFNTAVFFNGSGGVIYNLGDNIDIQNNNFINNSASYRHSTSSSPSNINGGVIYNSGNNINFTNNNFDNNYAFTAANYFKISGDVIYNLGGNVNFLKTNFTNNYGGSGIIYNLGKITINNGTFSNNKASVIYNNGTLIIFDGIFTNNSYNQGGVVNNHGNLTIDNGEFNGQTATYGGVIANSNGNIVINGGNFLNNYASSAGGVIYNPNGNLNITGGNFLNNLGHNGNVIYNGGNGNVNILNGSFKDNNLTYIGGVIRNSGIVNIFDGEFINNSASGGGVIVNIDNNINIFGGKFINNTATSIGGVISIERGYIYILGAEFKSNKANLGGEIYNNGGIANIVNTKFIDSNASEGSAIYNYNLNITIINCLFNSSTTNALIYNEDVLFLNNNTMISNYSEKISNKGLIISEIILTIMGNNTIFMDYDTSRYINATLTDDNHNIIVGDYSLTLNNILLGDIIVFNYDGVYGNNYYPHNIGTFSINGSYDGGNNLTIKKGTLNVSKAIARINIITNDIEYGNDAWIFFAIDNNVASGNITAIITNSKGIIVHNRTYSFSDSSIQLSNLASDNYTVNMTFNGNNFYFNSSNQSSFTVKRAQSQLNIIANDINYGEEIIIYANLNDLYNLGLNGTVEITIDNKNYTINITNGIGNTTISNLSSGNYSIIANYLGNQNYTNARNNSSKFNVNKINTNLIIQCDDILSIENGIINVNMSKSDVGGIVAIHIIGTNYKYNITLSNGAGSIILPLLNSSIYTIEGTYSGDRNYNGIINTTTFLVNHSNITMYITAPTVSKEENATIYINFSENFASGNVIVVVNNEMHEIKIINGKTNLTLEKLDVGQYLINAIYLGDNKFSPTSNNTYLNVIDTNKSSVNLSIDDINSTVGENLTVIVKITTINGTVNDGLVTIDILGKKYTANVSNGSSYVNILAPDISGEYKIDVFYDGAGIYNNYTTTSKIYVNKINTTLNVTIPQISSDENATIEINIPGEEATGNITININGINYTKNLTNGYASITLPTLKPGNYSVNVFYSGDEKYESSYYFDTLNVKDSFKSSLIVDNIIMFYKNGTPLIGHLTDINGNPLANMNITFFINERNYTRITNSSGHASMSINLDPNLYDIVTRFEGYGNYLQAQVNSTILVKTTIMGENITKYYLNNTQYYINLFDNQGKQLTNASVLMNINGVIYNRTTDDKGILKLTINLNPGKYTITVYHPNNEQLYSNEINVLSRIKAEDIVKYYLNDTRYIAKLVDSEGKALANYSITMNINGALYTRPTDENGIVSLAINLYPGKYIITLTDPLTNQSFSNTIEILSTLIGSNLNKTFEESKAYEVRILDGKGNPLANQNIAININGVFYNRTSDIDGIVRLNINLNPGSYIATAIWNNYLTSNIINVKQ